MDLNDKFNLFVKELNPIDSKVIKPKHRNIEYWIKLTNNKINNWCVFDGHLLESLSIEELIDKYKRVRDLKQKEYGM